ncbi:S41 family peptidase [Streptomyces mirabilis]|uniref:S41 family peptidase n=1 Tax=Streptomyces mirabilis TaxID=68239 RepID=UPI0036D09EBA
MQHDLVGTPLLTFANGRIGYARLPDGTGYLRISGFGGYEGKSPTYARDSAILDQTLSQVIRRGLRGLVLDLRINVGGSDALALQVAGRLTERAYVAYAKRARNDPTDRVATPTRSRYASSRHPTGSGTPALSQCSLTSPRPTTRPLTVRASPLTSARATSFRR